MSRFTAPWRGESGQSQILAASVIGVVIVTSALFGLQYALQNRIASVKGGRRSELRAALDQAAKHVTYLYHSESACVPETLNTKLNRLQLDGSIGAQATAATRRQMDLTFNGKTVRVGFGAIRLGGGDPGLGPNSELPVRPQDATVEVFASLANVRVTQRIGLINNCTLACATRTYSRRGDTRLGVFPDAGWGIAAVVPPAPSADSPSDPCLSIDAVDPAGMAFHYITHAERYPGVGPYPDSVVPNSAGVWNARCFGGRKIGELDYYPPAPGTPDDLVTCTPGGQQPLARMNSGVIGVDDLTALRNYVRSGDVRGSCQAVMVGDGSGGAGPDARGCGDINGDGVVDVRDVGLLEKALRGYLYWLPTHY